MLDGDYFVLSCLGSFVDNVASMFGEHEHAAQLTTALFRANFTTETQRRLVNATEGDRLAIAAPRAQRDEDDLRRSALEASYANMYRAGGAPPPAPAPVPAPVPAPRLPPAGEAVNALGFVNTTGFRGEALPRVLFNYSSFSVVLRLLVSPNFLGALARVLSFIQASHQYDRVLGGAPLLEMIASPTVMPLLATLVGCELLIARNRAVRGAAVTVSARRELVNIEKQARLALCDGIDLCGEYDAAHWRAPAVDANMRFPYRDAWGMRR
jgi:hypothetical protein